MLAWSDRSHGLGWDILQIAGEHSVASPRKLRRKRRSRKSKSGIKQITTGNLRHFFPHFKASSMLLENLEQRTRDIS